jgi:hypothetical protein
LRDNKLPTQFFCRLFLKWDLADLRSDGHVLDRHGHKPLYIDLNSPVQYNFFLKHIQKAPVHIRMEDPLPTGDSLMQIDAKRYMSEFIVQWEVTADNH